jgi:hypothetical protein
MASKLKNLSIRQIGIVDQGANPDAMIALAKRASGTHTPELTMTEQEKAALEKEVADTKAALEKATADLAALKQETAPPDLAAARKAYTEVSTELTKVRGELQAQLETVTKELNEARSEVVKIQTQRRRERFIKFAHELEHLPGAQADDFAEQLDIYEKAVGSEKFDKFCQRLRSWNTIIQRSKVFEEIGRESGAPPFGSAEGALRALAKERAGTAKITFEKAYAQVLEEQPDLYKRYLAEKER